MVLFLIILQALPVFLVGVMSQNKQLLWSAAIVMTIIAALTGSSKYFLGDFIGIVIAFGAAYAMIEDSDKNT